MFTPIYFRNLEWQYFELGNGGWVYDDFNIRFYYKNGMEYEELNEAVGFSNIDFMLNDNYLEYNGFRIESSTTLKTITRLFPIQSINKRMRYDDPQEELYEFGTN
ncbi:hypothetical protein GCM10022393_13570 [Aquimarina addita]|uniref:Uncharacterized protein n=1 Tax=Aquimarina addita TaxID=870485 RepID=A0ABP7XF16_9FLAO